jgi:hypothetical protein
VRPWLATALAGVLAAPLAPAAASSGPAAAETARNNGPGHIGVNAADGAPHGTDRIGDRPVSRITDPVSKQRLAGPPLATMIRSPELGGRSAVTPVASVEPPAVAPPAPLRAVALPEPAPAPDDGTLQPARPQPSGRDVLPEDASPVGLLAHRTKLPKGLDGSGLILPFAETTGAALFRRGSAYFVVFDERRPIDLTGVRGDPVFGQADIQLLPGGTLLRMPATDATAIILSPVPQGWRIAAVKAMPKSAPIVPVVADGVLNLAVEQPVDVVTLADPETGASLFLGTTRRFGQGVVTEWRTPEFILRPTGLGVMLEPLSDALSLKVTQAGFVLSSGTAGLIASPRTSETDTLAEAAKLTRRLDFPALPTEALLRRMKAQVAEAALAAPQARGPKRLAAARSMLALGMAAEAQVVLGVAAEDDPRQAASADVVALKAIAALLAGRVNEADGIDDPRLTGTDDIAFWRAIKAAMRDEASPGAAAVLAATVPLAMVYPKPIADRVVPLAVETMIQGNQTAPAARLLDRRKDDTSLDYARALLDQAEGNTERALERLDSLTTGHDQYNRARAGVRAVELRLTAGKLTAAEAADAMDKLLYAWRGDQRELALRERIAALLGQAGQWRPALSTLRQAEADFPEQAAAVHQQLQHAFTTMVSADGLKTMSPIDAVSAIDENTDLMPAQGGDPMLEEQLADRLLTLDLPDRAGPVLRKLMQSATSPASKARFGSTLAALDLRENDTAGVLAALDASDAADLPPDLAEKRTLLRANALAQGGDPAAAIKTLAALTTPAASEARAGILEQAQDWAGAEKAWSAFAATALPPDGELDDGQARTLLRLATAAARAGDDVTLGSLRERFATRLHPGAFADMFRLLTTQPVRGTGDLQRARRDLNLAQSLPATLKALDGSAPPP